MKIKRWELALAVGLLMAILLCAIPVRTQADLSEKLIRLHILANSDSEQDQELKLAVRDKVLASIDESSITPSLLKTLEQAAAAEIDARGYDYPVRVTQERMYFDTRVYNGFSLPAGMYEAVRILIGEGAGKNWWCVMFPPLCAGVCEEELSHVAEEAGLTGEEISFITEDGTGYVIKFKIAELWGKFTHIFYI